MSAVINVLPFESPAAVESEEILEIAHTLHEGAVLTITAPPILATLIERMAEGWNRDPNSHMAVEVGERRGGPGRVARDFAVRLRPDHWMTPIAEGRGWGYAPEPAPAPERIRGMDIEWPLVDGAWEYTTSAEYPDGAAEPTARVELQVRVRIGDTGRIAGQFKVLAGALPAYDTTITLEGIMDMRTALIYFEGIHDTLLGLWWDEAEAHAEAGKK